MLTRNYFSYDNKYYTCNTWPWDPPYPVLLQKFSSSTIKNLFIKHWIESTSVTYYSKYVDYIFIIFGTKNTTEDTILNNMNNTNKYIKFKMIAEEKNTINYLQLTITRYTDRLELDIFHKPTTTSTTIYAQSNHYQIYGSIRTRHIP